VEHRCVKAGCNELVSGNSRPYGYCTMHMPNREGHNREVAMSTARVYEEVKRLQRDSALRKRMLPTVAAEQEDKCVGFWDSTGVEDGKAINLCPWGQDKVPKWAQQLDHITPYAETQDDSRDNLQMLCACCHAGKTAAERGAASVGEIVGQ